MIEIDIYGSCITRDIFEYDENMDTFNIKEFVSRNSLFSAISDEVKLDSFDDNISLESWALKCVKTDIYKKTFERLSESTAKKLVIDLIDERHKLIMIEPNNSIITDSIYFKRSGLITNIKNNYKVIDAKEFPKSKLEYSIDILAKKILKIYSGKDIIINKGLYAENYKSVNGYIIEFENKKMLEIKKMNAYLSFLYEKLKKKIPECHMIELPQYIIADENNKWGLEPYHYIDAYYRAALNKLKDICINKNL